MASGENASAERYLMTNNAIYGLKLLSTQTIIEYVLRENEINRYGQSERDPNTVISKNNNPTRVHSFHDLNTAFFKASISS